MTPADELANIRIIRQLCAIWEGPDYRPEDIIPFFTDDCAVRLMHTLPFAHGPLAVVEQAKSLMPTGTERMKVRHLSTQFTGQMVIAHRIDTLIIPGKPDSEWEMLGVFLIDDGKVREWTDYMLTPFSQAADGTVQPVGLASP